jgi:hypothetical protein
LQSIVISETQAETLGTASSNSARRRGTPILVSQSVDPATKRVFATFAPWIERRVPRFSIEVGTSLALAALLTEADLIGPKAFRENCKEAVGRPAWRQRRVMPFDDSDPPAAARRSVPGACEIGSARH